MALAILPHILSVIASDKSGGSGSCNDGDGSSCSGAASLYGNHSGPIGELLQAVKRSGVGSRSVAHHTNVVAVFFFALFVIVGFVCLVRVHRERARQLELNYIGSDQALRVFESEAILHRISQGQPIWSNTVARIPRTDERRGHRTSQDSRDSFVRFYSHHLDGIKNKRSPCTPSGDASDVSIDMHRYSGETLSEPAPVRIRC